MERRTEKTTAYVKKSLKQAILHIAKEDLNEVSESKAIDILLQEAVAARGYLK